MKHLDDVELYELAREGRLHPHLEVCSRCRRHRAVLVQVAEGSGELAREADAAFPPERLAEQRARIARRLARLGGGMAHGVSRRAGTTAERDPLPDAPPHPQAARVLPFPARHPLPRRQKAPVRWAAAAAAAGLIVGLFAGRGFDRRLSPAPASEPAPSPVLRPTGTMADSRAERAHPALALSDLLAEEPLLVEIDAALASPRVAELQAIDALTPRIREP
ncbi:MAG TPA: hypothetical protein VNI83_11970 [Vicinamibacterales bacterium]|nr:hypothetical protein [Vicinamibacterales bacterium]